MNSSPGASVGLLLKDLGALCQHKLLIHMPSASGISRPEFHCLEQSLGSGVSAGANCLFGLALAARLASRQPTLQLGEPDKQHRWL